MIDRTGARRPALAAIAVSLGIAAGCSGPTPSPAPDATLAPPTATGPPAAPPPVAPASAAGPAYVIVEQPSGRVIASARADEIERDVWPGSIATIPLLEAALERGVVTAATALVCRRDLVVGDHRLTCSHPDLARPLTAAEALAHSCSTFFVTVAHRVPRDALNARRTARGWPPIGPDDPFVPAALGLAGPTVPARQLVDVVIGAIVDPPADLDPAAGAILVEGLRGAATFGASEALGDMAGEVFATTGSAPLGGGGVMGLIAIWRPSPSAWAPRDAGVSMVLLAPGAAGRDAAAIARPLLDPHVPGPFVPAPAAPAGRPLPAIRLDLPAAEERERGAILTLAEQAIEALETRTGRRAPATVTIRVHPTVESFRRATGRPEWVAGTTAGDRVDTLPLDVLLARDALRPTLTRELAHVILNPALEGRPAWVREGLAAFFAGETSGAVPPGAGCPEDDELRRPRDEAAARDAYARALACVRRELATGRPWTLVGGGGA